jgi:hypothetical protein
MIKNRHSEDHLSKELILNKIREIDIFSYYCNSFKELGKYFCSELREDKSPGVNIVQWKGKLLYKDFAHPDHTFDCFAYVMEKYSCGFYDALRIVDNDFQLNLASHKAEIQFTMGYLGLRTKRKESPKKLVIIKKKSRKWMKKDAEFWSKYLISKKTLTIFGVSPISHYWINERRFSGALSYAYRIGTKYKIYSPYEEIKWISNTTKKHIQGYDQLPEKGNLCIITSSLKDVMCLYEMGIPAVALQSEMQMPEESLIQELKGRFKEIALFYDNDFTNVHNPGQSMAKKIINKYAHSTNIYSPTISNIVIPDDYQVKDLSDYIAKFNSFGGLRTLIELQTWQQGPPVIIDTTRIKQ